MVHRNHFFGLYQQIKLSESKVKFRQASNCSKRVLKIAKLACANKAKESITSKKLGSWNFWQIANIVLNKGKSAIPLLFNGLEVLSSASNKAKLFAQTLLRTLILMTDVSLYLFSLVEVIWSCNLSVTPKMVKKVITNLIHQKHQVLFVFQWWFWRTESLNFLIY